MRDFKGMKRQRGRNRNGSGATGGGGKPQQNVNRAFDSNGPDNVKIRGHAQHVFEKYQQLARDAFSSGDRVLAENYLQHADHYFRVLRMLQPQRPAAEILGRDVFTSGLDIDFEDEGEGFEDSGEAAPEPQDTASNGFNGSESRDTRSDRDRSDRDRSDRDRSERYDSRPDRRDDRFEGRSDAPRTQTFEPRREAEGNRDVRRDNRRFEGRSERAPRDNQARDNQARDGQSRDGQTRDVPAREFQPRDNQARDGQAREFQGRDNQTRGEGSSRGEYRDERPVRGEDRYGGRNDGERAVSDAPRESDRRDPLAVIEPESAPLMPAKFVEVEASPMLRSQDGGVSEAPAFLQSAVGLDDSGEVRRPRTRRRRPKALDEGDDAAPAPAVEEA
jgi:hypothetical protein